MMYRIICLLNFLLVASFSISQGISFYEGDWKDALAKAKAEDKLIFVDAYAKWCGPCKMMAKKVFTEASVGDFYNTRFINLKIDMEVGQGLEFGRKYPIRGYPTLMFLDGDGNVVLKKTGARQVEALIDLGKEALLKFDRSEDYAAQYEEGERDFNFMLKYIKELNKVGKPSLRVANKYLRSNPDLAPEQHALFVMEAATEADSRLFDLFMENRELAIKQTSEDEVNEKIALACHNTVKKAVEFESEFLIEEAKNKMKKFNKTNYTAFECETDMYYAQAFNQVDDYTNATKQYVKKIIGKDAKKLNDLAMEMIGKFGNSEKVLEEAENIAKKSIKLNENDISYRMNLVKIQLAASKNKEALKTAKEILDIATNNGENTRQIEGTIKYIESILEKT